MTYLIEKYLGEAAPKAANLKFGDQVEQNSKARKGTGKAKIDASIWSWADKKFGGKGEYSITNQSAAIQKQEIQIHKAKGSMGSIGITIKPFGDYIMVLNDKGGGMTKADKKFFKV
jgi:hypothetical protein